MTTMKDKILKWFSHKRSDNKQVIFFTSTTMHQAFIFKESKSYHSPMLSLTAS